MRRLQEFLRQQADAYLEELRTATAAAHERLRAGTMISNQPEPRPEADPIFATREFTVPPGLERPE